MSTAVGPLKSTIRSALVVETPGEPTPGPLSPSLLEWGPRPSQQPPSMEFSKRAQAAPCCLVSTQPRALALPLLTFSPAPLCPVWETGRLTHLLPIESSGNTTLFLGGCLQPVLGAGTQQSPAP